MTDKHTPGPWRVTGTRGRSIKTLDGTAVAYCDNPAVSGHADARLIAAAPDLLAALRDLQASVQKWAPTIDRSRGRAAIAKATGEGE